MSKVVIKSGIALLFTLLLILSGCKKEPELTAKFEITGERSLHFNFGQTKEIAFSSILIQKFEQPTPPQGWACRIEKNKIIITAPLDGSGGTLLEGDFEIKAIANSGSELTKTISVAAKIASTLTPANSFITPDPDKRYKFDARLKGSEITESLATVGVKLVWTSVKSAVGHISLEDGFIYFATDSATPLTEGNAVIAALDSKENIIWSWHVWCADYDPDTNMDELEGEKVMNRNLGAFASSGDSSDDAFASYGLYYQWGRKDPFVGPKTWNSSGQHNIYNDTSTKPFLITYNGTSASIGTVAYTIANPTHFITGAKESDFDWLFAARDNSLWGNGNTSSGVTDVKGTKSLYDPCPAGWMVAPPFIWRSFTKLGAASKVYEDFNVSNTYIPGEWYGWVFTDNALFEEASAIYYPAAGRRSFSIAKDKGNFSNVVEDAPVGFYWSNSNSSATDGALLAFNNSYINPASTKPVQFDRAEGARAGGFPLRCVKE